MKSNVFSGFLLIFIIGLVGCQRGDSDNNPIIPPVDTIPDWREKYVGEYYFNVMEISFSPIDSITWDMDTLYYEYNGSIEKYDTNRLLIKYSPLPPIARCIQGQGWCSGGINDACITECPPECIKFVEHWISPIIYSNDSLLLFPEYSRLNGSGIFSGDSISYFLYLYEKLYGWEVYIQGNK